MDSDVEILQTQPNLDTHFGLLLEFLEICIHHLIFIHKIYPAGIFSRKQRYGVAVQTSDHPEVNAYINKCLSTARTLLNLNNLEKLLLVFLQPNQAPVKTITFDITSFKAQINAAKCDMARLELSFRDAFLRISMCDRKLSTISEDCSFKILLATSEESYLQLTQKSDSKEHYEFPWIQSERKAEDFSLDQLISLASVESKAVSLQIYAQESFKEDDHASTKCPESEPEMSILSQEY